MIARSRCRHVKFAVSRQQGMRKLIKSLIPGRLMIFLPDEDLGAENAVFAPFFGTAKASLTTPARLAKLGKACCLPAFAWYDPDSQKYRLQIAPPLNQQDIEYPGSDAITNAKILNASLEALIKQHPEQYMWQLRLFRTRPEGEKQIY
jgi:lauroyl/myristoyl acyltransferase